VYLSRTFLQKFLEVFFFNKITASFTFLILGFNFIYIYGKDVNLALRKGFDVPLGKSVK